MPTSSCDPLPPMRIAPTQHAPLASRLYCAAIGLLIAVVVVTSQLRAEPTTADAPQKQVSSEQIRQWAVQLDADRFDQRHLAQRNLELTGIPALKDVAEIANTGSLESSTRAINILLLWSESKDSVLRFAALEKLASLQDRPRESAMASQVLSAAREETALENLTKLGAKYTYDRIHGFNKLQIILGPKWKGGYDGLKHLADVPRASTISLHSAPVNDQALEHLAKLPHLQRVELYGTSISQEAIEKFKQQTKSPNVKVDPREGALLGVEGNIQGTIIRVPPNTAAARAGIVAGDRITAYNGEKIADFKALTDRISKCKPGDSAKLTVQRKTKTIELEVTFGDWGSVDFSQNAPRNRIRIQGRNGMPQGIPQQTPIKRR